MREWNHPTKLKTVRKNSDGNSSYCSSAIGLVSNSDRAQISRHICLQKKTANSSKLGTSCHIPQQLHVSLCHKIPLLLLDPAYDLAAELFYRMAFSIIVQMQACFWHVAQHLGHAIGKMCILDFATRALLPWLTTISAAAAVPLSSLLHDRFAIASKLPAATRPSARQAASHT